MQDAGLDPFDLLKKIQGRGKIIAASIRSVADLLRCLELGCSAVTIGDKLFNEITSDNPFTLKSLKEFQVL